MSGFIDDSWILISASIVNLLWYGIPVEVYEENLAAYIYAVGKGRSMLRVFSVNCGYYTLILHQNSTCGSFSELPAMWNLKSYQGPFLCYIKYSVTIKFTSLKKK